jgi:hypothetical protein
MSLKQSVNSEGDDLNARKIMNSNSGQQNLVGKWVTHVSLSSCRKFLSTFKDFIPF